MAETSTKAGIGSNLKRDILTELYENSRISVRKLALKLGVDYYTVAKTIAELERKNRLLYTLDIDPHRLGFLEGKIITIKFERAPDVSVLRREFQNDVFIQSAYFAKGDFDVLLCVVALSGYQYAIWEWTLRATLGAYRPHFFESDINYTIIGFFPTSSEIIDFSNELSEREKSVLKTLNDNSRMRLKGIMSKTGLSQMKLLTTIKKLRAKRVIRKLTTLVSNPEKKLVTASFLQYLPTMKHRAHQAEIGKRILDENFTHATSDYAIASDLTGYYDMLLLCNFEGNSEYSKRGPALWRSVCKRESVRVVEAVLVEVVVGAWPLHGDKYWDYAEFVKRIKADENEYRRIRDLVKRGKIESVSSYYTGKSEG